MADVNPEKKQAPGSGPETDPNGKTKSGAGADPGASATAASKLDAAMALGRSRVAMAAADAAKNALASGMGVFRKLGSGVLGRIKDTILGILSVPLLIVRGDLSARLLLLGFVSSLALLAITSMQLFERFAPRRGLKTPHSVPAGHEVEGNAEQGVDHEDSGEEEEDLSGGVSKFFEEQKRLTVATANVLYLDRFSATLRSDYDKAKVFEVEVYVECDAPETSALLKAHYDEVRELISSAVQGQVYEQLITEDGKNGFRQRIVDAVNGGLQTKWKSGGVVRRVFFTKFIMG